MSAKSVEIIPASGTEVLSPLNKLKTSANNARKKPHGEAAIEGYAASIGAKGGLQNLVVEPELDAEGTASGFDLVTIGEGRRLAQLLRVEMAAAAEQRRRPSTGCHCCCVRPKRRIGAMRETQGHDFRSQSCK